MPIKFLPSRNAATKNDPDPHVLSKTMSPILEYVRIKYLANSTGFCVG